MTVLDQAFIKAYLQQGSGSGSALGESSRAVPLSDALAASPPSPTGNGVSAASVLDVLQSLAGSCEPPGAAQSATEVATQPAARTASRRARASATGAAPVPAPHFVARGPQPTPPNVQDLGMPRAPQGEGELKRLTARLENGSKRVPLFPSNRTEPAAVPAPGAAVAEPTPVEPAVEAVPASPRVAEWPSRPTEPLPHVEPVSTTTVREEFAEPAPEAAAPCQPQDGHSPSAGSIEGLAPANSLDAVAKPFEPQLQVDRFAWPKVCHRLATTADAALNELAAGIVALLAQGDRIVAVTASRRGEGATTLMLCAAQRLAYTGHRVALVDADVGHADVARRLGLLPECGWEDVLRGRLPLSDVLVQSVDDRLTLLPLNDPLACTVDARTHIIESLETLREHYDVVLVNLPPWDESRSPDVWRAMGGTRGLDAAVLVHDVRSNGYRSPDEACRQLQEAGLAKVAVVENFVNA